MEKYLVGDSVLYGSLVCRPAKLTEVKETAFFEKLNKSLKDNNLLQFKEIALKKKNLKNGVTVGKDYFAIETNAKIKEAK